MSKLLFEKNKEIYQQVVCWKIYPAWEAFSRQEEKNVTDEDRHVLEDRKCQGRIQKGFGRVGAVSRTPFWLKISFSWDILENLDKFGRPYLSQIVAYLTLYLILLFINSILLPVSVYKIAGWVTNSIDPDQTPRSAVWAYTICSGLSVRVRRLRTVIWSNRIPNYTESASECILKLNEIMSVFPGALEKRREPKTLWQLSYNGAVTHWRMSQTCARRLEEKSENFRNKSETRN